MPADSSETSPEPGAPPDDPGEPPGWLKSRRARIEESMQHARERIEAKRETSTTVAVAYEALGRDAETGGSVLAAALGFRIFLFFVPYVFFFVFAFGFGAAAADNAPEDVVRRSGMGGITARAVGNAADLSLGARIVTICVTGYALYAGARGVVKVLRIVHGLVWRVPVPRLRRSWRGALALTIVVTLAFAASVAISALRDRFLVGGIAALILYTFVPFAVWLYVSWLLPHADCDVWSLVPGAVLFGVGFEILHLVTVIWIPYLVSSKSATYGAIGIALVLLFWAYLVGRVMALSAVLNASLYFRTEAALPAMPPVNPAVRDLIHGVIGWRPFRRRRTPDATGAEVPADHGDTPGV